MKKIHKFIIGGIIITALLKIPYLKYQTFDLAGLMGLIIMGSLVGWIGYGIAGIFARKNKTKGVDVINREKEVDVETGKKLINAINELDEIMMKAAGTPSVTIAGGHDAMQRVLDEGKAIINEIMPEFVKKHPDATNLYWIMLWTQAHLMHIDCAIASEIQHADKHRKSCQILLKLFPYAHAMVDDLDNPKGWVGQFSRSNNRKVKELAPKVGHYLEEYHKALYYTENSIKNAIKFEAENLINT